MEQQGKVLTMVSTLITSNPISSTSVAVLPSTTAPSLSVAPQAAENLPSSSHHHQLPVTSLPTLTDNFFLEDLAEDDKTDITDDDLALLSSPSLITCSDQSYYESDTMPSTMQIPPSANPPLQCIPPQFQPHGSTQISPPQIPAHPYQSPAQYPYQSPVLYPHQNPVQYPHQSPAQYPHQIPPQTQQPSSPLHVRPPPPPFATPPKLRPVEEVIKDHPGTDVSILRELTTALAREAVFGREELSKCSLSGRKNTISLNKRKLEYIKSVVRSRVPEKSQVDFELIWKLCRSSLSKSCQTIRTNTKKRN